MKLKEILFSKAKCLLIALVILPFTFAEAQNGEIDTDISSNKMKARAKYAIETGDIYTALFYYEEIVKKDSSDIDACFEMAELYRQSRNYSKAEKSYEYVYHKLPAKYPFALFYKAQMQKMRGLYEEARDNMNLFKKQFGSITDRTFLAMLNKEIAGCDIGITNREFADHIQVENVGNSVNHPHTEYSPFMLDTNTLIYGSLRMDSLRYFDVKNEHYEKPPARQIYLATKSKNEWKDKGTFDAINDPSMDMGNFVYNSQASKYYFTKCLKNDRGHVTCKIYFTEKIKGGWTKPEALPSPINMEGYTSTQPAILIDTVVSTALNTPQQKLQQKNQKNSKSKQNNSKIPAKPTVNKTEFLYFVSDRPGGKGGLDIWYTSYSSARKVWSQPVNMSALNTSETECTPFYHTPTQTLYFSSNGHVSSGGLDIYKTKRDSLRRFIKPQNLAFPINSSQDDLGYMLYEDGKKGMLVSNRPGGTPYFHETCCDDIYGFTVLPIIPFNCTLQLSVLAQDKLPCKGRLMKMESINLSTNEAKSDTIRLKDCNYQLALKKNHQYAFSLEPMKGYENDTLMVTTHDMASEIVLEKKLVVKLKETVQPIEVKPVEGVPFVLNDVQYEPNQVDLNENAKRSLDSILIPFLKAHPKDKLLISSHTDDLGTHKYNIHLSQQRSDKVVEYLISKGIPAHRLEDKGYGETKPIAPNKNSDGTDNPIGRSFNRRTEFLLLKPQ
jgi:outer membrane protein OmpA-like peptidoglycan-associated protein